MQGHISEAGGFARKTFGSAPLPPPFALAPSLIPSAPGPWAKSLKSHRPHHAQALSRGMAAE